MSQTYLEHSNITVANPNITAELLCKLFDWKIRWAGPALNNGHSVHVGGRQSYVALYTQTRVSPAKKSADASTVTQAPRCQYPGKLNHLGLVVSDLELVKRRIHQAGITTFNHQAYEPGRRLYFKAEDNLEIEVVSYQEKRRVFSFFELASLSK